MSKNEFTAEVYAEWSAKHPKNLGYPDYERMSFLVCPRVGDTLVFGSCCWEVVKVFLYPTSSGIPVRIKVKFWAYD